MANRGAQLMNIRDSLHSELSRFSDISVSLNETDGNYNKIDETYTEYNDKIGSSGKKIADLKRREMLENTFIYIGFYFFLFCCAIIFLRRFPFHVLIKYLYYGLDCTYTAILGLVSQDHVKSEL